MARYNLLDEAWIRVMVDAKGNTQEVSLLEVFKNSPKYLGLAGDSQTQDFAMMRFLLAVLHTVYSRVDAEGEPYPYMQLDERWQPTESLDEDDLDDYVDDLLVTWKETWEKGEFSTAITDYLENWRDRFYLFSEEAPFCQVSRDFMQKYKPDLLKPRSKSGRVYGKDINRRITESANKIALFAPKTGDAKESLTEAEVARWLLTYQGYTGTAGKQTFRAKDISETWSKGWLYDIGGLYFKGETLFETLMLNLVMMHPEESYRGKTQRPAWEQEEEELVNRYLKDFRVDNLAELYTNWSRAIYIDPDMDPNKGFECVPIKLLEIDHLSPFIEPMTLFRFQTQGPSKDNFTPRKHRFNQSLWRSFGMISGDSSSENKRPGIISWHDFLLDDHFLEEDQAHLIAVSMEDDGNATSWAPINEIYDELLIDDLILTDGKDDGWIVRLNSVVEETQEVVERVFGRYLNQIEQIRFGRVVGGLVQREKAQLYFKIDEPFRDWLANLDYDASKDDQIQEWRQELRQLTNQAAITLMRSANSRDIRGRSIDDKLLNLPMAFNAFQGYLNHKLGK